MVQLDSFLISPHHAVREAIARIDQNGKGIVLVVDEQRKLLGTITDGDVRRAILKGTDLTSPVEQLLKLKASSPYASPFSAPQGTSAEEALQIMRQYSIRHLPLLDASGRVQDLLLLDSLAPSPQLPLTAVVMAGGYGTRLLPLTKEMPKPMLPINGRPILEWIIERLQRSGIHQIIVTTHYKSEAIMRHFGNGQTFGVDIHYIHEDQLTGTAGPLGLIKDWSRTFLVINGDILTQVDFRKILDYHRDHRADMTVAVRQYHFQVPYGVVETEDVFIKRLTEKPELLFFVNAGIYLLEPSVQQYVPQNQFFNMTDLIERLLHHGHRVISFPVREYWMDIGQHAQYEQAQKDMQNLPLPD